MSSEAELATLIQLGHDLTSFKTYVVCVTALLVYDYFLTLKDEIRYAWRTESVLIFVLFLFTRYLPLVFHTWVIIAFSYTGYTYECSRTAFIQVLYYTFISAFAQIVLAQRVFAITRKNKWVAATLYTISAVQFGVGIYMLVSATLNPAIQLPSIPLDSFHLCLADIQKAFTLTQMSLCLVFDISVFVLVIVQTQIMKSMYHGMNGPSILQTVSRDAEIYFAAISTNHLVIVVMYIATRPGIRSIPVVGSAAFIPLMISRLIMSLKKVASSREPHMTMELPSGMLMDLQDTYPSNTPESVRLNVFRR